MAKKIKGEAAERLPPLKERTHHLSLYLDPAVYDRLREVAYTERVKMHSLILEGIDMMLKKRSSKRNAA